MNHLFRDLAPISDAGWQEIEKEARRTLKTTLGRAQAGGLRRAAGLAGIGCWHRPQRAGRAAVARQVCEARLAQGAADGRIARAVRTAPQRADAIDRGAKDPDTDPIIEAARKIAIAEDRAVFHGYPAAGIRGICEGRRTAPDRRDYGGLSGLGGQRIEHGCATRAWTVRSRSR